MKNVLFLSFILFTAFTSCKKANLDALAFPREKLDAYTFDNSSVSPSLAISEANRTLVAMPSVDTETGETHTIYGVYIGDTTRIAIDSIILYCHGQSKHMDAYWGRASLLANVGEKYRYGVFMMDYRGFGMSEGIPTEQGLYDDVDASIDWLKAHGATGDRTFYYGFSLGCIPVIDRAAYRTDFKPAKIMLEAPLASVENLAHSSLILNVDPNFVSTLEFNNAEKIKDVTAPLLWLHGVEDDYIAISNGELVFENHPGPKEAVRVEDGDHDDVPSVYGIQKYLNRIEVFMQE